jgi:hypothetical protein
VEAGQAGLVSEQMSQRYRVFALRGELRPVVGHRLVERQQAPVHRLKHGDGSERLGDGEQAHQGVLLPGTLAAPIGMAVPDVHH